MVGRYRLIVICGKPRWVCPIAKVGVIGARSAGIIHNPCGSVDNSPSRNPCPLPCVELIPVGVSGRLYDRSGPFVPYPAEKKKGTVWPPFFFENDDRSRTHVPAPNDRLRLAGIELVRVFFPFTFHVRLGRSIRVGVVIAGVEREAFTRLRLVPIAVFHIPDAIASKERAHCFFRLHGLRKYEVRPASQRRPIRRRP